MGVVKLDMTITSNHRKYIPVEHRKTLYYAVAGVIVPIYTLIAFIAARK